jgi:hypothetical protein
VVRSLTSIRRTGNYFFRRRESDDGHEPSVLRLGRAEAQARVRALRKLELVAVGSISSCNSIPSLVYIEVALVMSMLLS